MTLKWTDELQPIILPLSISMFLIIEILIISSDSSKLQEVHFHENLAVLC